MTQQNNIRCVGVELNYMPLQCCLLYGDLPISIDLYFIKQLAIVMMDVATAATVPDVPV